MNAGEVYFALRGDCFEPGLVTRVLGIEPSRVSRKAHPVPKSSSWVLSSGKVVAEVIDVYAMGEAIIAQLPGSAEAIRELAKLHSLDATMQVVLTISPDDGLSTPAIGFSSESIQFLASVGASIDVDTYRGAS